MVQVKINAGTFKAKLDYLVQKGVKVQQLTDHTGVIGYMGQGGSYSYDFPSGVITVNVTHHVLLSQQALEADILKFLSE